MSADDGWSFVSCIAATFTECELLEVDKFGPTTADPVRVELDNRKVSPGV